MIKMIRGLRVLRGGRGRALRLGVVAVVVVWAWVALLSGSSENDTATRPQGRVSRSPSLQVVPPINDQQTTSHHAPLKIDNDKEQSPKKVSFSEDVNPRYNNAAKNAEVDLPPLRNEDFDDIVEDDEVKDDVGGVKEDGDGPDAREDYDEEDEEEEAADDEDQGKWGGRNKMANEREEVDGEDEDANAAEDNMAMEEEGEEEVEETPLQAKERRRKAQMIPGRNGGNREKLWERNHNLEEKSQLEHEVNLNAVVGKEVEDVGAKEEPIDFVDGNEVQKDDWGAIEDDLRARRMRVKEVCKKYHLGPFARPGSSPLIKHPPTPNYDVFYIDRKDGLAWCPIYKAASTTWLYNFILLGGLSESYVQNTKEQVSNVARKLWPPIEYSQADMAFKVCLKFMIVRHPFERIVSAYRDKLENTNIGKEHGVEHFYQKYGRKIVAKFRSEGQSPPAKRYSQDMDDPSLPPPKGIEPTFEEFVRYLINTDLVYYADDHWMPYYLHCTPCLVDYDVIAKFETLERDQKYIIHKKNLGKKVEVSWKHLTKGKKTSDTVKKYFATITKDQLLKLYEKYKVDFELFNYSIEDYIPYVKHT